MSTETPRYPSPFRLVFWRAAAVTTEVALRNRQWLLSAWPYGLMLAGGLLAYAVGYYVGLLAFAPAP
jgi:hypothetical protein